MKQIQLTKGQLTQVDDADYAFLNQWKWRVNSNGYAIRSDYSNGQKKTIRMHRLITNCPPNRIVDHIDGNPLNNQASNLRICTQEENCRNVKMPNTNTSGIKGVCWDRSKKKWMAKIQINKKTIFLGRFDDINAAQQAYEQGSIKYHGEYGRVC